jgi:flagella basal body P-ring formation protein FlgA
MSKYYELTVWLAEDGWRKEIKKTEVIRSDTCNHLETDDYFDEFIYSDIQSETSITTRDETKIETYCDQAKRKIIKRLQRAQDRINKLLEVGK